MNKKEGLWVLIVLVILVLPLMSAYDGKSTSYDVTVSSISVGGFEETKAPNTSKYFSIDYMPVRSGNSTNYTVDLGISRKLGPIAFNITMTPEIAKADSIINCTGKNIFSDKEMPKSWYRFSQGNGSYYTSWATNGIFDCTSVGGCFEGNLTCHYKVDDSHLNSTEVTKTILVDTTEPSINLESPENQTIWNQSLVILFEYNVTENQGLDFCELIVDGEIIDTDYSVAKDTTQNFTAVIEKGTHLWNVNCTDSAGNVAESETWEITQDHGDLFTIENVGITGFEAVNPEYTYTSSVILYLELAPTSTKCRFRNLGTNWSEWQSCDTVTYWTLPSGNGYKTVDVQINHTGVDDGLISEYTDRIILETSGEHLDTTPPESFIVYDQGDYTNNHNNYHANWNLPRDKESQILGKDLIYDYILKDINGTSITSWNTTTSREVTIQGLDLVENHTYILYVNATNTAGLSVQSSSDGITVDLTPPSMISLTANLNQSIWTNKDDINISWSAIDLISGVKGYSVILDNVNDTEPDIILDTTKNNVSYTDLKEGIYYFHIKAIDAAGNIITSASHYGPVKIDKTSPTKPVAITPALVGNGDNITFYWRASTDVLSGISNYTVNITDIDANLSYVNATTGLNFTITNSTYGNNYYILIVATDLAGNNIVSDIASIFPLTILSAKPNSTTSSITDDPIIKVETSKNATCRQNYTNEKFIFTGATYHETKIRQDDGTYSLKITCIDSNNYAAFAIINYVIDKGALLPAPVIGTINMTFVGKDVIVPVLITDTEQIPKEEFKVFINDTPFNDFTLLDKENGNYQIIFKAGSPGTFDIKVEIESGFDTADFNVTDIVLNLKVKDISGSSSQSSLAYTTIDGKRVGIASDANKTTISSDATSFSLDADTTGRAYLFFTKDFNAEKKNWDIENKKFQTGSNTFGYPKEHAYNIDALVEYKSIKVIGLEYLQEGTYSLFIRNEGHEGNTTVLSIEHS